MYSEEAEAAVIGSVLINPSMKDGIVLYPDDFFVRKHGMIWEAIHGVEVVDILTVQQWLDNSGLLEEIGGPAYLTKLVTTPPTSLNAEAYARIVKDKAMRRNAQAIATEIHRAAGNGSSFSPSEYARELTDLGQVNGGIRTAEEIGVDFLSAIGEEHRVFPSGIGKLDTALGKLERKILHIVGGRPSMGKTAICLQLARNVANTQKVIFFSFEMDEMGLWARMACGDCGLEWRTVKAGGYTDEQLRPLYRKSDELIARYGRRFIIDDKPKSTDEIWQVVAAERPDMIVIDHLSKVKNRGDNEPLRLGSISGGVKEIAKRFDCHAIIATQLNRKVEDRSDKRPLLSDLKWSGDIEQDADIVTMLYREEYYEGGDTGHTEALVRKNRDGPTAMINLWFHPIRQWFFEEETR